VDLGERLAAGYGAAGPSLWSAAPGSRAPEGGPGIHVFVVGFPRSGTTLLYHMLLSSGNFAVYRMESQILTLFEPRFRPLSKPRNKRKMLDAWYSTRLYQRSGLQPSEIEPRIMAECQNGGDFLRILMEEICRKQGVQRWAETTPEHLLYMRRIKQTIPNALIIHVIRTNKIPFIQSIASWQMILSSIIVVAVGYWLTISPWAKTLGFVQLPWSFWGFLLLLLLGYATLTQTVKSWFFKKFGE